MLKVLHTGDWHIGSFPGPEVGGQNARFQDICRCLDFQAMYAEEHRPDLIVVSGDIFHQARVWSDRGLRESRTAIDHIRRLSNVAPTVVLRGTPNHDSEEQFEMLTTAFYGDDSVSVVTEPEVLHIHTYHGQRVDVACIPGFDRGVHRAAHPGLSREEETQVFTDELAKVVLGLKAQCEPGVTSILSTHFTVPGCNMESGQTALFAQFEPVIYPATLKAADFDLVALGHIHRPQQLPEAGRAVFYCGSITGLNFNDENQPRGFYIHDIDDDGEAWSEYVETPYREFETIRLGEDDVHAMLSAERVVVPDRLKGKIVRVLYTCSDETNKAFNKAVLEKRLYDGGVFYVSEITPEEITTSVNRDELHGDNSPEQNLAEYLTEKEKSPEDAQRIIELARPIISEAMEKGRLETPTGVFMPVEIEVKNYRNYRDELFSYKLDRKNTKYCAKLDIRKFYPSSKAPAVMQELRHVIKCKRMLRLCETVLNSSDGLPIGNYTSQWFANFLLQRLDHFIKEVLHIRYFVRYMDDMCLWASSKKLLHRAVKAIEKFLAGLGLVLKANWQIFPTAARAVDFLGFRFFREKTTLRKNLALRLRRRVKKTYKHTQKTGRVRARDAAAVMSYCGWLKHAHCHGFFVKYVKPYVNFKKLKEAIRHEARIRARTAYCVGNAAQPRTV